MSKAKIAGQVAYNPENRKLWDWSDQVDWMLDDIADGKSAAGEERVLDNGWIARYSVDADGDGFLFVVSQHLGNDGTVDETIQYVKPLGRVIEVKDVQTTE